MCTELNSALAIFEKHGIANLIFGYIHMWNSNMRWEALFSPIENTYSGIGSLPVRTTLDGTLYSKKYIC